jgi:hypothetical protein
MMNERIRELNLQALSEVLNGADPDRDIAQMYIPAEFTKKFAELIVQECMQVCKNEAAWDPAGLPYKPSEQFHDAIKQHFGVE